jgi:FAD-dependent urate hydroxylase
MSNSNQVRLPKRVKSPSSTDCEVVVLGAGPYGLSAGVYLKAKDIHVRVFGEPMDFWANQMPKGMLLRSPREASNIADPRSDFTLDAYEATSGMKPVAPVPLETFVGYGRWFQEQLSSEIDRRTISLISRQSSTFKIALQDGTVVRSRRVVVAAGIGAFQRKPSVFGQLPSSQVSHCYEGRKIGEFAGKRVAVIGSGQSALESAALLHEAGSEVEVIARIPAIRWIGMHKWLHELGPFSSMLYSKYDVGPAGISRLVAYPQIMAHIPLGLRDKIRVRAVRPAGSKWLPARLLPVKISTGRSVQSARWWEDEIQLQLDDGTERRVDHVLLGTGYDVDIARYNFLSPELVAGVGRLNGYPDLGKGFSTTIPGLHFIGATAARSFGPLLYFVAGTEFASKELTTYISRHSKSLRKIRP